MTMTVYVGTCLRKFDLKTFEYSIERVEYTANSNNVASNTVVKCHMPIESNIIWICLQFVIKIHILDCTIDYCM